MRVRIYSYTLVLCAMVLPASARAALGGDASTVQTDQVSMKASLRPATASNGTYQVHSLQTPAGVTVREYVSGSGKVFAVVWQGPIMPNLQQLLGQYFSSYRHAAKARHYQRAPLSLHQADLVVQSGGHLRAFAGRAYIPSLVPAGVTPDTLR